jgi:hypothetical protein
VNTVPPARGRPRNRSPSPDTATIRHDMAVAMSHQCDSASDSPSSLPDPAIPGARSRRARDANDSKKKKAATSSQLGDLLLQIPTTLRSGRILHH